MYKELINKAYLRDARKAMFELVLKKRIPFALYTIQCDNAILEKDLAKAQYFYNKMCAV